MPDINQYKNNPTKMAIFLIQTIAEMHLAKAVSPGVALVEQRNSLKHGARQENGKGRAFPAQAFLSSQFHLQRYLSLFKPNFIFAPGSR